VALATGACTAGAARAQTPAAADSVVVRLAPDTAGAGLLAAAARAPRAVRVRGGGEAAGVLRDALARPHVLVVAPDTGLTLGRDVRADRPLVVVGGPLRLAATVPGDVVVVGELFLRPGADVDGRSAAARTTRRSPASAAVSSRIATSRSTRHPTGRAVSCSTRAEWPARRSPGSAFPGCAVSASRRTTA
jgi:hypothetical protein